MESQEFRDLGKLARKRTRDAVLSVGQLLEGDQERAALLVSCAVDFIGGAVELLRDDQTSEQEALGEVLGMLFSTLDVHKVAIALKTVREKR